MKRRVTFLVDRRGRNWYILSMYINHERVAMAEYTIKNRRSNGGARMWKEVTVEYFKVNKKTGRINFLSKEKINFLWMVSTKEIHNNIKSRLAYKILRK